MITKENQIMLNLLGSSLHSRKSEPVESDSWQIILKEMVAQTVFALPSEYVNLEKINHTEKTKYIQMTAKNIQTYHILMSEQQKLLDVLDNANIPSVILKGSSAAVNYPEPAYRCMGDIDIIVKPDEFEKAFHIMCSAGYSTVESVEKYHRHIVFNTDKGIHIELHNYFSTSRNKKQNTFLDQCIYNGIDRREVTELSGYKIAVLPVLENGLVLLGHINQHIGGGLGLRQIIDWMFYVEKYLSDDFWNTAFVEYVEKTGMKTLAIAVTAMCRKYLSFESDSTWCNGADESLCDELMEYILTHGNFGRKNSTLSTTITVLRWFRNPIYGFKELQKTGCRTWKTLDKHKWLTPLAWLYQIFRLINHGIKRGVTLSTAKESKKQELSETELLQKLGVTRL
ncbi:MAG: nucleotidyltransferase family protein [Ruminococcus sp.]|nr:nucleotidyltransferase family protein [Ruminococcus sp.]